MHFNQSQIYLVESKNFAYTIETMKNTIKIFPNPVANTLHVSVDTNEIPNLQIYTINGILIKEIKAKDMNVSNIPIGTYILKVKTNNRTESFPLMISR